MKKGSIFRKLLLYLLCACLLTALLSVVIYAFTGVDFFARRIADEMTPRAYSVARLASRYLTGQVSYDSFIDFALREQQGASIYIYDENGNLLEYASDVSIDKNGAFLQSCAATVLETGDSFTYTKWRAGNGIIAGVPISDNMRRVAGVILISKPTREVRAAMDTLIVAALTSSVAVTLIMVVPVLVISRRISNPIRRMTEVSAAMANGDFTVRADESPRDEVGRLGRALNHLCAQLNTTIGDLVLTRNRLHVILDGLHEGVVSFDHEGALVYCNPAAMQLFACADESELVKKLAPVQPLCSAAAASGEGRTQQLEAGERKLLLLISASQLSSDAQPGTVVVIQDITAAERLEQTRRDYVANVSHELRTPIASIRSLAETLNDGLIKNEDDRSRYYGYILRESMRLSRLINDLLELSRLQSGAIALEKQPFALDGVLKETVERMRTIASYSDIAIELSLPADTDWTVCSNRDRIEQVLVALLDNAIKFASDDGRIIVAAEPEAGEERMLITVKNTGHINEADLSHLFERFYKADAAHSDSGTGLGLAIVAEILALLGERIEAHNVGDYVEFCFTVARQRAKSA